MLFTGLIMRIVIRYIVSDCDAVSLVHDVQGYAKSPEDAVAIVLTAGMVLPFSFIPLVKVKKKEVYIVGHQSHSSFRHARMPVSLYSFPSLTHPFLSSAFCSSWGPCGAALG